MGMLQVKNLPDELHRALAARAREQGLSMSGYVTRLLRRVLSRPTITEWVAERRAEAPPARLIDVLGALEDVRGDYDEDLAERGAADPTSGTSDHP